MAEKLVLNANLIRKADRFVPKKCAVEKVIEVSETEFKTLIENPMKRNYHIAAYKDLAGFYDDSYHGILFVNKQNGDGFLVNSEGFDYARYSQFIPNAREIIREHEQTEAMKKFNEHLKSWVWGCVSDGANKPNFEVSFDEFLRAHDTRDALCDCFRAALENRPEIKNAVIENGQILVEKNDLTEIKLYCPLNFSVEFDESCDLEKVDSANFVDFDFEINKQIRRDLFGDEDAVERGLAAYFHDENLDKKIIYAMPKVETRDGEIYGVITVKSFGELEKSELIGLTEELSGQLADGWGEGFEQREIRLGEDSVYISFWSGDDDYFLKPESEVFPAQNFEQTMGGI